MEQRKERRGQYNKEKKKRVMKEEKKMKIQ
jgi:hypothetical protein